MKVKLDKDLFVKLENGRFILLETGREYQVDDYIFNQIELNKDNDLFTTEAYTADVEVDDPKPAKKRNRK